MNPASPPADPQYYHTIDTEEEVQQAEVFWRNMSTESLIYMFAPKTLHAEAIS
jgi:hypothetical protein